MSRHFAAIGRVPLRAVIDRPKTIAVKWTRDGHVTECNPLLAGVANDLSVGIELCWPASPWQKGAVENLVGWVEGSFFKQRRAKGRYSRSIVCNTSQPCPATGQALFAAGAFAEADPEALTYLTELTHRRPPCGCATSIACTPCWRPTATRRRTQ